MSGSQQNLNKQLISLNADTICNFFEIHASSSFSIFALSKNEDVIDKQGIWLTDTQRY